jgi:hypothetical protein
MPSTRKYNETYDNHDMHSTGSIEEESRGTLEYVQYTTPRKKGKGGGKKVILYPSNNPSKFVVNAVTGQKYSGIYPMSRASCQFFRVTDASAPTQMRVGEDGNRHMYTPQESNTFYYNSPEEYIKHARPRGIRPNVSKTQMYDWHAANREEFGNDEFLFVGGDDVSGYEDEGVGVGVVVK